ncbi:hypothetical protein [Caldovatus aquaticus]|uniref:Uncharacterized protein n=1 Tax=Caldovatus aquaticus TaxID=2865671 RepID=A0ABS7F9N4_9PROT|nr:hypothetical protein [Caldovatus aquaticus]MBW8271525.1 hypothetical protein [Caldovatus aquaticus]
MEDAVFPAPPIAQHRLDQIGFPRRFEACPRLARDALRAQAHESLFTAGSAPAHDGLGAPDASVVIWEVVPKADRFQIASTAELPQAQLFARP